jgi:hypothetical protein
MGGSELGDNDANDSMKPGQRVSDRSKKPVNYTSLAAGTGDASASMDYGEVSGIN